MFGRWSQGDEVGQGYQNLVAYGTAVKVSPA
jgi:hypothetical protein